MLKYTTDTYWALEAYYYGRLSVVENMVLHPNVGNFARKEVKHSKRSILKYRTMALVSEDREATGRG